MTWHLIKRELFEQLSSLRFCLATLLTVGLMVVNAIGYIDAHRTQQTDYRQKTTAALQEMERRCDTLYNLVISGPGQLYKKPSNLSFCAAGSEDKLPDAAAGRGAGWGMGPKINGVVYSTSGLWRMDYNIQPPLTGKDIFPTFLKIDWVLILTVVFSCLALVFTFDAISGEIESGTLRLTLSNAVPRRTLLTAKFLSAFVSLSLLFFIGALMNLLLLYLSGTLQLTTEECSRIAGIFVVVPIYLSVFIALGLLVSSRANSAAPSLVILLLLWTIWVILIPAALGNIVSGLNPAQSRRDSSRRHIVKNQTRERYLARGLLAAAPSRTHPPTSATQLWAEFLNEDRHAAERSNRELLQTQIREIQRAQNVNRISPTAIAQSALEALAGTGFQRHLQFLKNVDNYGKQFNDFLLDTDRADLDSLHVPFVREGMSDKPVTFASIPKFEDKTRLEDAFSVAMQEGMLLLLFFLVLFVAAHVSFQNRDI